MSLGRALLASITCSFLLLSGIGPVRAQASLISGLGGPQGYGEQTLHVNDDGYSTGINVGGLFPNGLNYFGTTQTTIYVNNNGNITFSGGVAYRSDKRRYVNSAEVGGNLASRVDPQPFCQRRVGTGQVVYTPFGLVAPV